jgi:hypothetical protein
MSKYYEICQYLARDIIYVDYGKESSEFRIFIHVQWLEMEISPKKFHRVEKDVVRFVVKVTKFEFDIKSFSTLDQGSHCRYSGDFLTEKTRPVNRNRKDRFWLGF